jgi:hypothetical protein
LLNKKTYYIAVASGQISQVRSASSYEFEIQATDDEVRFLRELFDEAYSEDIKSFFRAHVPYEQYHHDPQNDAYDSRIYQVYKYLHDFGSPETKQHIESMGILNEMEEVETEAPS